jgi:Rhodopirellula transposase DDE domain
LPQTDAIFAELKRVHDEAAASPETVRASYDAKATVKVGPFSRGGYSRAGTQAADHDFKATANLTPAGIFLPGEGELDLYFTSSKVTSDCIADVIEDWWGRNRQRFAGKKRLVLDLDNGPENHSRRSQFLLRMIRLAQEEQMTVVPAYYPPYHSKYNPIERCWGILENYWRGELLDSEEAVLGYAAKMTYNGKHPRVEKKAKQYNTGVRLSRQGLEGLERFVQRKQGLEKWAVVIPPPSPDQPIP